MNGAIDSAARQLEAMSYRNVLGRGFSVTRIAGKIVRSIAEVGACAAVSTELADGTFQSVTDSSLTGGSPEDSLKGKPARIAFQ